MSSHKDKDMRVMVLGAGLLGVTSAYYLQQLGHEVTVVDRHAQPAANALGREGTFSDSAQAATQALMQAAREARERAPMRANLARCLGALPAWWARRTGAGAGHDPGVPMEDFWRFSRHTVQALKQESAVPSPRPGRRLLQLYMDRRAFEATAARQPRLQAMGSERQLLSAEDAMRIEPMLQALGGRLAGATLSQDDF
ncbi:MAG TPA: FAD-dependent oxidoreductase, partial [Burkholderiaceae bacterium]|nr:FAD-dependent oxidoreductase [Burkholderiaceae bacterium]